MDSSRQSSAWSKRVQRLAWGFALWMTLAGCRRGCQEPLVEAGHASPDLLRRVQSPAEATPGVVDIADERDVFLVAGLRGPIQVWPEVGTGESPLATLPVGGSVSAARFIGGGELFFALETGHTNIWRWGEQRSVFSHDFMGHSRYATISADARFVAFDGAALERASRQYLGERKPLATQSSLAFAASGDRIVSTGFQEPWIVVRDLPSGAVREWLAPDKVTRAALSGRGDLVAAAVRDGGIHLWRQPGGELVGSWHGEKDVRALVFGAADATVIAADAEGFSVTEVTSRRERWRADIDGTLWVFSLDGDIVAAGTTDGRVRVWNLTRQVLEAEVRLSSSAIVALDVSARRRRFAAADDKGEAALWGWHEAAAAW